MQRTVELPEAARLKLASEAATPQSGAPFPDVALPYLLIAPQLLITFVFFLWPAAQAVYQSVLREDPFGLRREFIGLANFSRVLSQPGYLDAVGITVVFSIATVAIAMVIGLLLAMAADSLLKSARLYETLLLVPYAVAPAVAGAIWFFLMYPSLGILSGALQAMGYPWNHQINGTDALLMVIAASAWKQISYNVLFFLAGLQAIPKSLIEAAAIDGANAWSRFRYIILPLLSPTTFFLVVVNLNYAIFDTFAVIHATTSGGPGQSTTTLIYKVYKDGFVGLDLGGSAAQSVILMTVVILLTVLQFRYIERKVTY